MVYAPFPPVSLLSGIARRAASLLANIKLKSVLGYPCFLYAPCHILKPYVLICNMACSASQNVLFGLAEQAIL